MDNFLKATIGSQKRKVKIEAINKEYVINKSGKESEKIVFTVLDETLNKSFVISDCWTWDNKQLNLKIAGLWYLADHTGKLAPESTLAKFLTFLNVKTLNELINKELYVYPDPKNFLVLINADVPESVLEKSLMNLKNNKDE